MADAENPRRPGHIAARTLWLSQGLIAAYLAILWVMDIPLDLNYPSYGANAYPFVRELFLAILAAIIVYTVVVQWYYPDPHPRVTARLELGKGIIATAMWAWLLLDAIFFIPGYPYYYDPYCRRRAVRITFIAWSIAIPCVFFYPAVFWSARLAREARKREAAVADGTPAGENTPLLRG